MSVRPVAFDPSGGIAVGHDERGHGGAVAFADVRFGRNPDNTVNVGFISITCPVCGAVSTHPIGGGAAPAWVQKLFLRTFLRRAAALGLAADFATIKQQVRQRVAAMDGPGRFRLGAMQGEDDPVDD